MLSQVFYLAAGLAGLPVFAASPDLPQGPARLLGPTGGYLMAYPFAALVTGVLARRGFDRRYLTSVRRDGHRPRRSSLRAASSGSRCSRPAPTDARCRRRFESASTPSSPPTS